MKKLISLLLFLLIPGICNAATVYLDIAATGCTGGGQANTNYYPATRSCGSGSAKVYAGNYPYEAGKALSDGDTLYIRTGEYYENVTGKAGYNWFWGSMYISASNVTIKPYNNEIVWIKGGVSRTSVAAHPNNALAFYGSNIVIDDLYVYGGIIFMGTNNIMQNCDLSGGWDHQSGIGSDAWYDIIRFYGSTNAIVRNCAIHDNNNHGTATANENKACIMHDQDQNTIVENCNFYNPVAGWIYAKYQSTLGTIHATYRYNWFGVSNSAPFTGGSAYHGKQLIVYQNVFIENSSNPYFYRWGMDNQNFIIYNNTFYNVGASAYSWNGVSGAYNFFNNIIYANSGTKYALDFNECTDTLAGIYSDYNDIYATGSASIQWRFNYQNWQSLSAWQSGNGYNYDSHSVSSNPNFLNASGSFSQPSDFKRTSYPQGGRGGSWPSVMGAYITGNEIIGSLTGKRPSPPPNLQ